MWITIGIIACIFAAYMYWVNGRSIFENRSAPTEAEKEQIQRIVSFEQENMEFNNKMMNLLDEVSQVVHD